MDILLILVKDDCLSASGMLEAAFENQFHFIFLLKMLPSGGRIRLALER